MSASTCLRSMQQSLNRMNAGDTAAAEQLFCLSIDRLRAIARTNMHSFSRLRPHADTNDLLQNSVITLQRALQQLQVESVSNYLGLSAIIIRREALNLTRKLFGPNGIATNEVRTSGLPSGIRIPQQADSTPTAESIALSYEVWQRFYMTIEALDDRQREVVDLLWTHRLGQREAAEILGISERAVRKRWSKAKERLGRILRDLDDE